MSSDEPPQPPQPEHTVLEQLEVRWAAAAPTRVRLTRRAQAERARLENALRHLDASNAELREALARDGPDPARRRARAQPRAPR